eukprot:COSAG01_NODE_379_length_17872_cov_8.030102_3_plen_87_part_00
MDRTAVRTANASLRRPASVKFYQTKLRGCRGLWVNLLGLGLDACWLWGTQDTAAQLLPAIRAMPQQVPCQPSLRQAQECSTAFLPR